MKRLSELLPPDVVGVAGSVEIPIRSVAFDSRACVPGSLFVALPGTNVDGASFIGKAMEQGAVAVVAEGNPPAVEVPLVRVSNARKCLSWIARQFFGDPSARATLLGITGTKGKTTTTYLVQSVLRRAFGQAWRFGTVEYDLGGAVLPAKNTTPESLELVSLMSRAMRKGVRAGVMEVSSHALKTWRVEDVTFSAAGFSNLSLEHTEFHPDMEDYFRAKARLFLELLPKNRTAVIGIDDDYGRRLAAECRRADRKTVTVSIVDPAADLFPEGIERIGQTPGRPRPPGESGARSHPWTPGTGRPRPPGESGARSHPWTPGTVFSIVENGTRFPCRTSLVGMFNVFNTLMAAGLCRSIGVGWEDILEGLAALESVPGRFEAIANTRGLTVVVDYAHSPEALRNLLVTIRPMTAGRVITVFGCGGNRSPQKRPIMGKFSASMSDITIITSDNPRKEDPNEIIRQILAGIPDLGRMPKGKVYSEADRRKAISMALDLARPGDSVLIAGKGHETGQTFADRTIPFDDREVARELLGSRHHA